MNLKKFDSLVNDDNMEYIYLLTKYIMNNHINSVEELKNDDDIDDLFDTLSSNPYILENFDDMPQYEKEYCSISDNFDKLSESEKKKFLIKYYNLFYQKIVFPYDLYNFILNKEI